MCAVASDAIATKTSKRADLAGTMILDEVTHDGT